jgi:probable rRNA maturation factor
MDSDSSRTLEVTVEAEAWLRAVTDLEALCRRVISTTLAAEQPALVQRAEVSLLLTNDAAARRLNREWRGKDSPTNVLSFPGNDAPLNLQGSHPVLLGDVVLAFETVRREADAEAKPIEWHLAHLLVHGTLHLLGYDHEGTEEAERMERREAEILAGLGVPDPYREELAA